MLYVRKEDIPMKRCPNCSTLLRSVDKFCPECGTPIKNVNQSQRTQVFEGKIHKCPNCGEAIDSFTKNCPSCNFEFRDVKSTLSIKEFEQQLHKLDAKRTDDNQDTTDQQIINLIQSFAIPNTKEDITEFMLLASSSIVDDSARSQAWMTKMEQCFHKAYLVFGDDPDYSRIQSIYNSKIKIYQQAKKKTSRSIKGTLALSLILCLSPIIFAICFVKKEDRIEQKLNETVLEIEIDLANGDYDSALFKANTLYFDKSLSHQKAEQWDEKREAIIQLINEKKEGN